VKLCGFEGCSHKAKSHGLCASHNRQRLRGTPLRPLAAPRGRQGSGRRGPRADRRRTEPPCSFEGCGRPNNGKGLCAAHRAQRKQGRPLVPVGAAKRWWWPIESM
jgi:hypothetical protein